MQSRTTPYPGHRIGRLQNTREYNLQESQEVSPFPVGDYKAAINRQDSVAKTNTKNKKKSTKKAPPWNGQPRKILEGLSAFHGTSLTLNSDVDQDT